VSDRERTDRIIAQDVKVPHAGPANVLVCLDSRRHKCRPPPMQAICAQATGADGPKMPDATLPVEKLDLRSVLMLSTAADMLSKIGWI
jgi:hypothetical protein